MKTNVVRLPLADTVPLTAETTPLTKRISDLCEVQAAAGFRLVTAFVVGPDLILIFQH